MRENAATLDAGEMIAYPLVTEDERTEHEHARRVQELRAHHERHLRTQGFRVVDGACPQARRRAGGMPRGVCLPRGRSCAG